MGNKPNGKSIIISSYPDEEIWKVYEENPRYMISTHGRVMSLIRDKWHKRGTDPYILKPGKSTYLLVSTVTETEKTNSYIHMMVAKAFIPNPDNLPWINHKDCNKYNNHVSNLEWCTPEYNEKHAKENGRKLSMHGELNGHAVFGDDDIIAIRQRFSSGETVRSLADEYDVAYITIYSIVKRLRWKHIN